MIAEEYLKEKYSRGGVNTTSMFDYFEVIALMEDYHHAKMLTYYLPYNNLSPQDKALSELITYLEGRQP